MTVQVLNVARAVALALMLAPAVASAAPHGAPRKIEGPLSIFIPGGERGVGFDDLRFSPALHMILAPAGRTGITALISPTDLRRTLIPGFSMSPRYRGGHDDGPTSADGGDGVLYVTDRTARRLYVADPGTGAILGSVALAAGPDYVRYVRATDEVWVTEPEREQIEIFTAKGKGAQRRGNPLPAGAIKVPGGPESLVIDEVRGMAYTHAWKGATFAIAMRGRKIAGRWPNGCAGSRGIALDESLGVLFAACAEGQAVALDVAHDGRRLSRVTVGAGVDGIAYDPERRHLYVPGGRSASMAIVGVSTAGALSLLGTLPTARGAQCVAAAAGRAFVCKPDGGQILMIPDPYPPAPH
jgi:hypothetical protein